MNEQFAVPHPSQAALAALGRWADELSSDGFAFGEWAKVAPDRMPYVDLLPDGMRFLRAVGELGFIHPFPWVAWLEGPGARYREDRSLISQAPADDLVRLMTAIVRSDRFSEGALLEAFESGLLLRLVRRAGELGGDPTPPA